MSGVLLQAATEANDSFRVKDALSLIWSALPEKPIDNAVICKRLPQATAGMCVSQ